MTTQFKTGQAYYSRSACNHECIYTFKIIRRTAKSVWVIGESIKEATRRSLKLHEGSEFFFPFGRYSMAPIIRANRPVV